MAKRPATNKVRLLDLTRALESRRYYIYPFAPVGANVFSVGPEGSSKTATWRWLALEAAWAGVSVVYFSEDMSPQDDRILMHRYLRGLDVREKDFPYETLAWVEQQGMNLNTRQGKQVWMDTITKHRANLVVNDNYNSLFGGRMAADGYANWDTAAAYAALLKDIGREFPDLSIVTICNPPNSNPERLPGGQHLPAACDLRLVFTDRGSPSDGVSRFKVRNTKGSRIALPMDYGGKIVGPRGDDLGPLRVILKPQGDTESVEFRRRDSWDKPSKPSKSGRSNSSIRTRTSSTGSPSSSVSTKKTPQRLVGRPRDADPSQGALRTRRYRKRKTSQTKRHKPR